MSTAKQRVIVMGPTGTQGGLQTHHDEMCRFLIASGHEVLKIDFLLNQIGASQQKICANNITIRPSRGLIGGVKKMLDTVRAGIKVRRFNASLIIACANGYGYALLAAARRRKNTFAINTEVICDFPDGDRLRRFMLSIFDATAVQSPGLLNAQTVKLGGKHKHKVLPCFNRPLPKGSMAKKPRSEENIRIAFFGRLASNKGIEHLIASISHISAEERPQVDIWGTGPLEKRIAEQIVKHDLMNYVSLKGKYPEGQAYAELLATYHGLVLPSQAHEGLPLVLLEASSVGLPFLATNVGAMADCAINNPDARICEVGQSSLNVAFQSWLDAISMGDLDPERLAAWYEKYHSRERQEGQWLRMMDCPTEYFK